MPEKILLLSFQLRADIHIKLLEAAQTRSLVLFVVTQLNSKFKVSVLQHGNMGNVSYLVLSRALDEHNFFLCGNKTSVPYSCIIPESSVTDTSEIYPFVFYTLKLKISD